MKTFFLIYIASIILIYFLIKAADNQPLNLETPNEALEKKYERRVGLLLKSFVGIMLFSFLIVATPLLYSTIKNSGVRNIINSSSTGLETSKEAYRQGYSDGQKGYGLPASARASAQEFYMAGGYNYSSADYKVYVMGFNDGTYGRTQ